jgi:hypothetical protein
LLVVAVIVGVVILALAGTAVPVPRRRYGSRRPRVERTWTSSPATARTAVSLRARKRPPPNDCAVLVAGLAAAAQQCHAGGIAVDRALATS